MIVSLIIVTIVIGLGIGLFMLFKIARMPKVQPKKIVLEHTQAVNNHLFQARQQLHTYISDVLSFYYQGDENALAARMQHIASGLHDAQRSLDKFVEGYEPYTSRSSEAQFIQTATAYHTAAQQFIGQLRDVVADLQVLQQFTIGIRAISKQAESLSQFVDEADTTKQTQLADQLTVVLRLCDDLHSIKVEPLKLPQGKTVYGSLQQAIQKLAESYAAAKAQLTADPGQYFKVINAVEPSHLVDSNSYIELFGHLIQDTHFEPYQQAIDQLYYQA